MPVVLSTIPVASILRALWRAARGKTWEEVRPVFCARAYLLLRRDEIPNIEELARRAVELVQMVRVKMHHLQEHHVVD
jgi:hypothetical protein